MKHAGETFKEIRAEIIRRNITPADIRAMFK